MERKAIEKTCPHCGELFDTTDKRRRFCSKGCSAAYHNRIKYKENIRKRIRICECCGKVFLMRPPSGKAASGYVNEGLYCSRHCRWYVFKEQHGKKVKKKCRVYFYKCASCGALFTTRRKGKSVCSIGCMHFIRNKERHSVFDAVCSECGVVFTVEYGDKRRLFCSQECLARHHHRIAKAKRRAVERGADAERVNPIKVFMRDGWRCQICGKKLDQKNRGTHKDNAPELDHIIPLAEGGEHSYKNTQCACRKCNASKGADGYGQQLLLFGM